MYLGTSALEYDNSRPSSPSSQATSIEGRDKPYVTLYTLGADANLIASTCVQGIIQVGRAMATLDVCCRFKEVLSPCV